MARWRRACGGADGIMKVVVPWGVGLGEVLVGGDRIEHVGVVGQLSGLGLGLGLGRVD